MKKLCLTLTAVFLLFGLLAGQSFAAGLMNRGVAANIERGAAFERGARAMDVERGLNARLDRQLNRGLERNLDRGFGLNAGNERVIKFQRNIGGGFERISTFENELGETIVRKVDVEPRIGGGLQREVTEAPLDRAEEVIGGFNLNDFGF
jgi:hypothetical protein